MENFLKDIQNVAFLSFYAMKLQSELYSREEINARLTMENMLTPIRALIDELNRNGYKQGEELINIWQTMNSFLSRGIFSFSQGADEAGKLVEKLYETASLYGKIDVEEENIRLFSSKSGFLNFEDLKYHAVYHSAENPLWEAFQLAKRIYNQNITSFSFLGCDLGYLPYALFLFSDKSNDIYIFHDDPKMIEYAKEYGLLSYIPNEKLHIFIGKDRLELFDKFSDRYDIEGEMGYFVYDEFVIRLNEIEKDVLNSFYILNHSGTIFKNFIDINIKRNLINVKQFENKFIQDNSVEYIVVAGGPSVNYRIDYIKENAGRKKIICASTSFKKLLEAGIRPDIVCVCDPQERTWGHFDGVEDENVPLLMSLCANWRFGELYHGPKFLVCERGYENKVPYSKDSFEVWNGFCTVSEMAIEIAIHFGAKSIELIGLDLAYPNGDSHAAGTMDYKKVNTEKMEMVPSVNGDLVPTTHVFKVYIQNVEKIIERDSNIIFYNLSKEGALIKGALAK